MSKLFDIKADANLNFSIESKLLDNVRKINAWYTSQKFSGPMLVFLVIIDIWGFMQIANLTMMDSPENRFIIISGFAVAFEIAPLYIGYVLCLKSYNLWRPVNKFDLGKFVVVLSSLAFILGLIANSVYRILTIDTYAISGSAGGEQDLSSYPLAITIVMILLPIITSFVNIVIGCLSFDPLMFHLLRLAKKIKTLKIKKRQLAACIEELSGDDILKESLVDTENTYFENTQYEIEAINSRLINYVILKSANAFSEQNTP
ncbi:MAG: hypothetical protein LBM65_02080 [Oscillospiraceae bacterium]|jgi:hypothetical protein|nr:hypothetical protein [Oscillospiraceae bacterium]